MSRPKTSSLVSLEEEHVAVRVRLAMLKEAGASPGEIRSCQGELSTIEGQIRSQRVPN